MLEYDNSAFYYFALSTISFYVFPSWYSILKRLRKAFLAKDAEIGAVARTSTEKAKAAELKKTSRGFQTLKSTSFLVNTTLTILASLIIVYLLVSLSQDGEVHSFDPYHILGVDTGADIKSIKRAYKTLSLKYHPDKCKDPSCEPMFMMIAKAHEALTDVTARENWEKYGNPDGKQSLEVSIGLPTLLLDTNNRNLILMVYLIIMVIVIPSVVYKYYSDSSKYGEKNVMYETYSWYHHNLSEHTLVKTLPEIFAGSAEFREDNMPRTQAERDEVTKVMGLVRSQMLKPKMNHPVLIKGNCFLHAHLLRNADKLSDEGRESLKDMLRTSNSLVEAMISICQHQNWLQTALNCIQFGQYITQACWIKDSSLLQLPHFTAEEVKHCEKGKAAVKATTLAQYLKIPDDQKKGIATMTDEQKKDVMKCCSLIPDLTIEQKIFVDDDEDAKVYEGDLLTVQVTLTRNNLEEGEKAGLVHAPHFPFPKNEAWWIVLGTREGKIISAEKVTDPSRVVEHNIKFLAPEQGEYEFDLHVMSNAYLSLDQKHKVKLSTLDASVLPEYKVHPEDAELDDEPTLFEEMLNANVEEDSDSDDDDSDDESEEEGIKELTAAERKKLELRNARQKAAAAAGDDDSDDDSSVEEVYNEK
mmetsp:Transcript_20638/g.30326  ORF Transcript_20638/g.30326 Transcript_20638/m.30326 type:complete len:642 (-) Transcript_20638:83-2008(-)|eukprot:CAMPEP_0195520810 /NCGR_PEP_ID=MMETSP0794_2-20130614/17552_1 /TAXON_ID=515487 /ORGANISM="Stephanopyxis turris, Strain CCMP 815" /LENGTH=641 /DNA_ID=CAMNT_0040650237 /DNA_START=299 /DNA_END=2224 /DNA_ORIENTATION=+